MLTGSVYDSLLDICKGKKSGLSEIPSVFILKAGKSLLGNNITQSVFRQGLLGT